MPNSNTISLRSQIHFALYYLALAGICFLLPLHRSYTTIPFLVMAVNWLLEGRYITHFKQSFYKVWPWVFIGFYLLHLLGMVYTSNNPAGWDELRQKIFLLAVPIFMTSARKLNRRELEGIIWILVAGCLTTSVIAIVNAVDNYQTLGAKYLYYQELLQHGMLHPTYVSMFVIIAMLGLGYLWPRNRHRYWVRGLIAALLVYLTVFLFFLAARGQVLALFVILNVAVIWNAARRKKLWWGLGFLVLMNIGLFFFMKNVAERTYKRFLTLQKVEQIDLSSTELNSNEIRLSVWQAAKNVISDNLVLGVGTGDVVDAMTEQYEEMNFALGIQNHYNPHSQYMQYWIMLGLPGFLFFLALMLIPAILALIRKNSLLLMLMLLYIISCIPESAFEIQGGLLSFTVFFALFSFAAERD